MFNSNMLLLLCTCSIDSEHNHMVITIMKQEIGEEREYNASDIKSKFVDDFHVSNGSVTRDF